MAHAWIARLRERGFAPSLFFTITIDPAKIEHAGIHLEDYVTQREWLLARLRVLWQWFRRKGPLRYVRMYEWHRGLWDPVRKVENHRLHVHALIETSVVGGGVKGKYQESLDMPRLEAMALNLGRQSRCYDLPVGQNIDWLYFYVMKYCCKRKSAVHRYRVRLAQASQGLSKTVKETSRVVEFVRGTKTCSAGELLHHGFVPSVLGDLTGTTVWSKEAKAVLGQVADPFCLFQGNADGQSSQLV